ncbi:hypothetical protein [Streptomyces arenae]|uniref:hypothetical protein n=1 Tax=Streptomyces arenae TaxID=29301 RepID=UPI00265901C0|nr:hypothetical protein [Streptomyces arenae]MCG7204700.1 hypothetical protein [Streptomyces arenae]
MSNVDLVVSDTNADGHSVGVRLRTQRFDGTVHNWTWHRNYDGNGTTRGFLSSALDDNGIAKAGVEVGVFEGSDLLASCTTGMSTNPFA